jgi:DNA-binding NarL/FixJ family response regulator
MKMKPRLLLVDRHTLVLEALGVILGADYDIVGRAEDGVSALAFAQRLAPDIVVLELDLPSLAGLEVVRLLRTRQPNVRCVVVTEHIDRPRAVAALVSGARGYLLKDAAPAELLQAVAHVAAGELYISPRLDIRPDELRVRPSSAETPGQLTSRQREVLSRIAGGMAAKEIASDLGISLKTVEFHKACISRSLGVRTTAAMTRYAVAHGLMTARRTM